MLVVQILCLHIVIFIVVHPDHSGAQPPEVTCESNCTYTDRAKDAECTNRDFHTVPRAVSVCRRSLMFDISYNYITSLHNTSFVGFWQMKYLRIENNQITSIDPGTFKPIKSSLELLNVSSNHLTRIEDGTFVNMTKCKYILLSDNQIHFISSTAFQGMRRLLKLYLGDNSLTVLDITIFNGMPNLQEINLRNNRIVQLDLAFINYLPSLKKVFIPNNSIEEIVGAVSIIQISLVLLSLSGNLIEDFDCRKLENLPGLTDVYLGNNSLHTLHECRGPQVSALHLEDNLLNCDCGLASVASWWRRHPDASSPRCWTPENKRGVEVRDAVTDCDEINTLTTTLQNAHSEEISRKESTKSSSKHISHTEQKEELSTGDITRKENIQNEKNTTDPIDSIGESSLLLHIQNHLSVVLIVAAVLLLIIFILLYVLKRSCCSSNSADEGKKGYHSRESSCSDAESAQDAADIDSHKKPKQPCFACCRTVALEKEQESKGETFQPMIHHDYERVMNPNPPGYPRHFSSSSESSNTVMIRKTSDGLTGHPMANGMFNPVIEYTRCTCTCTCNDHISQYSEESYTDSDESYQIENQHNEMCDCSSGGVGVQSWVGDVHRHEQERMLPYERPPAYTPNDTACFDTQYPPPLPPMRWAEPVYIPHNQV